MSDVSMSNAAQDRSYAVDALALAVAEPMQAAFYRSPLSVLRPVAHTAICRAKTTKQTWPTTTTLFGNHTVRGRRSLFL